MTGLQKATQDQLKRLIERIERLQAEQKALGVDVADIFKEAKQLGFDVKVMRRIIAARRKSDEERNEEQELFDLYAHAVGLGDTPLERYIDEDRRSHAVGAEVAP